MKQQSRNKNPKKNISAKYKMGPKQSRHSSQEFGPGKTDIIFCPKGPEVYYYKSWHHNLQNYPYLKEEKPVNFKLCPFHQMQKNRQWEGEVRIPEVPEKYREQILRTAENVSIEAYRRDPMHRILNIKILKKEIKIYTSENQLAQKIAKKIAASLKNNFSKPKIFRGKGSDSVLVNMLWK